MQTRSKILIAIGAILLVIMIVFGIYTFSGPRTYKTLTYDELETLIEGDDAFILFIGSNNCSHCSIYKNTLEQVIQKYKIEINYIDISKLVDEEYAYLNSHFAFSVTPTTVLVEKGDKPSSERVVNKFKSAKKYNELVRILKKYEFIK